MLTLHRQAHELPVGLAAAQHTFRLSGQSCSSAWHCAPVGSPVSLPVAGIVLLSAVVVVASPVVVVTAAVVGSFVVVLVVVATAVVPLDSPPVSLLPDFGSPHATAHTTMRRENSGRWPDMDGKDWVCIIGVSSSCGGIVAADYFH